MSRVGKADVPTGLTLASFYNPQLCVSIARPPMQGGRRAGYRNLLDVAGTEVGPEWKISHGPSLQQTRRFPHWSRHSVRHV